MHPRSSSTGIVLGAVLCTFLFAVAAGAQSLWVRPLAGPLGGPGSADGYGSVARFYSPRGVAVTASGDTAFVADMDNSTIRKIDLATGAVSTLAGLARQPGSADGVGSASRFTYPYGVAVDASGTTVFVADTHNHTIRAIDAVTGTVSTLAGLALHTGSADGVGTAAAFNYPTGLAVNAAGTTVFVADYSNHTIRRLDVATRTVITLAGMAGAYGLADGVGSAARFNGPYGITTDTAGTVLYVGEPYNSAIRKIEVATGLVTTLVSGALGGVSGVAADAAGSVVFATDGSFRLFRVNTTTGASDLLAGALYYHGSADGTGTNARFRNPYGVATDAAGVTLYVADTGNDTIRRVVVTTAAVTTQAGRAPAMAGEPAVDGVGSQARFTWPLGVAVDSAGTTAYVAEGTGGCGIRQINLATGATTTLAGGATCGYADGVGEAARFQPGGIAVTGDGTVAFVADQGSNTIRRIDIASRTVTTLAGLAGAYGYDDGIGSAARFYNPSWVAVDAAGTTVFVTARWDAAIRMIDVATQAVTTLAGVSSQVGTADGIGSNARFTALFGVAVDASGAMVFVFDYRCVRQVVVATRAVTTLAGSCGVGGTTDGVGSAARFEDAQGIATDAAGTRVYVADTVSHTVRQVRVSTRAVTTVAGVAASVGSSFGVGPAAKLSTPYAVAVDGATRHVLITEYDAGKVRTAVPVTPRAGNFDSDGWTDVAVYRPASGTWFSLDSSTGWQTYRYQGWGIEAQGDKPVRGDFDGDGIMDPVIFRPTYGTWFILKSSSNYTDWTWFGWGTATDAPVPGDFDGDGVTDAAVYRPSSGEWYIRPSSGATPWSVTFGEVGDVLVPGDYDGDRVTDIAVYRPATGTWFVLPSSTHFTQLVYWGWGVEAEDDQPAPGDYDGDGKVDPTVYRPASGTWFVLTSSSNYTGWLWTGWGNAEDALAPGDYDGDATTDFAVYRPLTGTWYVKPSSGVAWLGIAFGAAGDIPLQGVR
jgi:DNA-binding beta-propeller fold protein YncE